MATFRYSLKINIYFKSCTFPYF